MDDHNVHVVNRIEHHCLLSCPCEACRQERFKRGLDKPAGSSSRVKTLSLDAAGVLFGFPRHPSGSLASELSKATESTSVSGENSNE